MKDFEWAVVSNQIQFTCNVWFNESKRICPTVEVDDNVSIERGAYFPYLDMEMYWSKSDDLMFRVHLKPNQKLKYLNKGSAHTSACLKAIPAGVCQRLAKLTTLDDVNGDKMLDELYPKHFKALKDAELLLKKTPTLREVLSKMKHDKVNTSELVCKNQKKKREGDRNRRRSTFFCIGVSRYPSTKSSEMLKRSSNLVG
jgi:hypothetical protein